MEMNEEDDKYSELASRSLVAHPMACIGGRQISKGGRSFGMLEMSFEEKLAGSMVLARS